MNCCCRCEYSFKCCGAQAFELGLLLLSWALWWLHPLVLLLMQTLRIRRLLSLCWCRLVSTRVQVNSSSRFFSPVRQGLHANAVGALELHGSVQLKEGLPDSLQYTHTCFYNYQYKNRPLKTSHKEIRLSETMPPVPHQWSTHSCLEKTSKETP